MTDSITGRLSTALADRYQIERHLGEGGMAIVYLAHDLKHDRKVAVKVLRPELAAILGGERFLNEIKVMANLQHPNILPLYDSGEADSFLYYVMPFIEGDTLRDKMNREKQLGVDDTVEIAKAVAAALSFAHEHDVVHRDIKPENILFQAGQAMVADFGIALAVSAAGGTRLTETGMSLGTPHYMSPEQATGDRELDARSDVYSLGAMVYEMLVGEPPHVGNSVQAIIAKILSNTPTPITRTRELVPPNVDAAVQRALARSPADRFTSAAQFAEALTNPAFALETRPVPSAKLPPRLRLGSLLPWALAGIATIVALFGWLRPGPSTGVSRFSVLLAQDQSLAVQSGRTFAISPDGQRLVYRGSGPVALQLFVRERDALEARPLAGTENGTTPFFSPDGEWIGFFANSRLKKVPLAGGPAVILGDAGADRGGTWTDDGYIIYTQSSGQGLSRVSAEGGDVERLTTPRADLGESSHRWPDALPGGRALIMTIFTGNLAEGSVAAYDVERDEIKVLVQGAFYGRWADSGHLVYVTSDGTLLAQQFDPDRLEVTSGPVALTQGVSTNLGSAATDFSISNSGTLVYLKAVAGDAILRVEPGGEEQVIVDSLGGAAESLRFSPDGRSLAFGMNADVWVYDLGGGTLSRRTFDGTNRYPTWSPSGDRISFASRRANTNGLDLLAKSADGSGQPTLLYEADYDQYEHEWVDADRLVVRQTVPETGRDIWNIALSDSQPPAALLQSEFNERAIALSPDGKWLAYVSDESGRADVYVRPFPGPEGKILISNSGGDEPAWTPDGQELIYRATGGVVAARLDIGSTVRVRERVILFDDVYERNTDHTDYDIHPTEGWFVFTRSIGPPPELIWVENFFEELKGKAGR